MHTIRRVVHMIWPYGMYDIAAKDIDTYDVIEEEDCGAMASEGLDLSDHDAPCSSLHYFELERHRQIFHSSDELDIFSYPIDFTDFNEAKVKRDREYDDKLQAQDSNTFVWEVNKMVDKPDGLVSGTVESPTKHTKGSCACCPNGEYVGQATVGVSKHHSHDKVYENEVMNSQETAYNDEEGHNDNNKGDNEMKREGKLKLPNYLPYCEGKSFTEAICPKIRPETQQSEHCDESNLISEMENGSDCIAFGSITNEYIITSNDNWDNHNPAEKGEIKELLAVDNVTDDESDIDYIAYGPMSEDPVANNAKSDDVIDTKAPISEDNSDVSVYEFTDQTCYQIEKLSMKKVPGFSAKNSGSCSTARKGKRKIDNIACGRMSEEPVVSKANRDIINANDAAAGDAAFADLEADSCNLGQEIHTVGTKIPNIGSQFNVDTSLSTIMTGVFEQDANNNPICRSQSDQDSEGLIEDGVTDQDREAAISYTCLDETLQCHFESVNKQPSGNIQKICILSPKNTISLQCGDSNSLELAQCLDEEDDGNSEKDQNILQNVGHRLEKQFEINKIALSDDTSGCQPDLKKLSGHQMAMPFPEDEHGGGSMKKHDSIDVGWDNDMKRNIQIDRPTRPKQLYTLEPLEASVSYEHTMSQEQAGQQKLFSSNITLSGNSVCAQPKWNEEKEHLKTYCLSSENVLNNDNPSEWLPQQEQCYQNHTFPVKLRETTPAPKVNSGLKVGQPGHDVDMGKSSTYCTTSLPKPNFFNIVNLRKYNKCMEHADVGSYENDMIDLKSVHRNDRHKKATRPLNNQLMPLDRSAHEYNGQGPRKNKYYNGNGTNLEVRNEVECTYVLANAGRVHEFPVPEGHCHWIKIKPCQMVVIQVHESVKLFPVCQTRFCVCRGPHESQNGILRKDLQTHTQCVDIHQNVVNIHASSPMRLHIQVGPDNSFGYSYKETPRKN